MKQCEMLTTDTAEIAKHAKNPVADSRCELNVFCGDRGMSERGLERK
jgi:hypothetical protein